MIFSSWCRILVFIVYAYWVTLTGPFFQNHLRDCVNEYGHLKKLQTKKKHK